MSRSFSAICASRRSRAIKKYDYVSQNLTANLGYMELSPLCISSYLIDRWAPSVVVMIEDLHSWLQLRIILNVDQRVKWPGVNRGPKIKTIGC